MGFAHKYNNSDKFNKSLALGDVVNSLEIATAISPISSHKLLGNSGKYSNCTRPF